MGVERNAYGVLLGKRERKGPFGNYGVDGKMLLNCIIIVLKNRLGMHGPDESRSVLGRVLCCVKTAMNFWVPYNARNLLPEELLAYQEGLCTTVLFI